MSRFEIDCSCDRCGGRVNADYTSIEVDGIVKKLCEHCSQMFDYFMARKT